MLHSVIASQIFFWRKEPRLLPHITEKVQELWDKRELQLAVQLSLFCQILLVLLGSRRKQCTRSWLHVILWLNYLCADWVAAVALGILSHGIENPGANELKAFWAPFLLLHLGGPEAITAYSLEDNELWLRHLLGLGVQGSLACYVTMKSWTGTWVSFLSVLMYVPAIIKYGERTYVLRSACKEQLRKSMLRPPDPGPSYAKFMDEYSFKDEQGYKVTVGSIEEDDEERPQSQATTESLGSEESDWILVKASYFFDIFKCLFASLILSYEDWEESKSFFRKISPEKAFELIDIELGIMFDKLYTKAAVIYSLEGCILRLISSFFTFTVSGLFLIRVDKQRHLPTDIIITCLLLALAVFLEIYGAIRLLMSDSAILQFRKLGIFQFRKLGLFQCINLAREWRRLRKLMSDSEMVSRVVRIPKPPRHRTRWSNSMGQLSIFEIWFRYNEPKGLDYVFFKICSIPKKPKWCTRYEEIPQALKDFIFQQLCKKSDQAIDFKEAKRLCTNRGGEVFQVGEYKDDLLELLRWSIEDIEFDQSILIWHIATHLCYWLGVYPERQEHRCLELSKYMLYLLLRCPFMLPEGIGELRFLDTDAEAMDFIKLMKEQNKLINKQTGEGRELVDLFLEVKTDIPPIEVKGPKSKSVLFDGCRLASQLKTLGESKRLDTISMAWVELLSFAAVQCKGQIHAKQLGRGGELLTHVWFLMAHLGITEQFENKTVASKLICK